MAADPAQRHGGPDAGWYVPGPDGWQRITDGEAGDHGDAAHFMSDPNGRHEPPRFTFSAGPRPPSMVSDGTVRTMGNPAEQVRWARAYIRERYGHGQDEAAS